MKEITFTNVEEMLNDRNAVDNGRYFLCNCPECEQPEAFIYKNNPRQINCNRADECGERFFIKYENVKSVEEIELASIKESYPDLTSEQVEALDWFKKAMMHFDKYDQSSVIHGGYRGLARETMKGTVIDLQDKGFVNGMFHKLQPLFEKDYRNNQFMAERNIVLPIYDEKGNPARMMLRSTINPTAEPKEIQLILNPSKQARDFFIDVPENAETIVVTEALFDALSFREIDPNVGYIALTGSRKTRQVVDYLIENKHFFANKNILFALDNDKAGMEAEEKILDVIEANGIEKGWAIFEYPDEISDPNEYLQTDRNDFIESYRDSVRYYKNEKNQMEMEPSL